MFILAWNARKMLHSSHLLLIGIAFLPISFLDAIHTLAYQGMGVFPGTTANLATQLWIAARYFQAVFFLMAVLLARKRVRPAVALGGGSIAVATLLMLSIFVWNVFPVCYIPDVGMTPFKKVSEYIISLLFLGSAVWIYQNREYYEDTVREAASGVSCPDDRCRIGLHSSMWASTLDPANLVGHILKIGSYFLVYRAVLVIGIASRPSISDFGTSRKANRPCRRRIFKHPSSRSRRERLS